nr:uncharacterized protein LOC109155335 [Ipomoea trifida]
MGESTGVSSGVGIDESLGVAGLWWLPVGGGGCTAAIVEAAAGWGAGPRLRRWAAGLEPWRRLGRWAAMEEAGLRWSSGEGDWAVERWRRLGRRPSSGGGAAVRCVRVRRRKEEAEIKSGGFGYGHIDSALQLENAPPEEEGTSIPQADVPPQPQPQEENPTLPKGLQDFVDEITSNTRIIATALLRILTLVETAPSPILENDRFKKMFESAMQLLGFKPQEEHDLTFSQREDAYLGNPDVLNSVDEIVRAVQKRTYLNDVPSFYPLYTVVNPLGDEDERYAKFSDNYLMDKTFVVETQWRNIQHFLFPIIASQHYYMIHFDPLCERFEAIDNSSKVCKTDDKYGIVPKTLQKFLSKFMTGLKSTYKSEKIEKLKLKRMKMSWRDNNNKIDCDVMSTKPGTYNKQQSLDWKIDFGGKFDIALSVGCFFDTID